MVTLPASESRLRRHSISRLAGLVMASGALVTLPACENLKKKVVENYPTEYEVDPTAAPSGAAFSGPDAGRPRIPVKLVPVASGFEQITDVQFPPGENDLMVVLEKPGRAVWYKPSKKARGELLSIKVTTASEQGLLGLAFHPKFAENGRFFLNYTTKDNGRDISRVEEWSIPKPPDLTTGGATAKRVIMDVEQPYANHNAGQLAFGPDGMLYVGWGDGGWRDDPHGHGQDGKSALGNMLRIDIDRTDAGKGYAIPPDNPFIGQACCSPETFAYGLRNPWRYSFDPAGRLIVADVGQNAWEEIDIVERGKNYGWNPREGFHCFEPKENCRSGFADPVFEYGREDGASITGGYVYTSSRVPALNGKYLFGDFVTGRLWAIELPAEPTGRVKTAHALGKWGILPATFGRDAVGEVYVTDFSKGVVYRFDPA